jgi:ubiquinone/menaquinone biosynthesis C-methylase UbiE
MASLTTPLKVSVDKIKLEQKVKLMYKNVAENPSGDYHFEMGRLLALKLGYLASDLDKIPSQAVDSFAGVGYHFGLSDLKPGSKIIDLGSGSGMDLFIASLKTGSSGSVVGVDMTDEQLKKSQELASQYGFNNVSFVKSYIEELPLEKSAFDIVISNGVINLSAEKARVFQQISKVLKRGGKMVISDIVTESHMPASITCNSTLWAACIGGAMQKDEYYSLIEKAGLKIRETIHNPQYEFISKSAQGASKDYGVKSISLLAEKI